MSVLEHSAEPNAGFTDLSGGKARSFGIRASARPVNWTSHLPDWGQPAVRNRARQGNDRGRNDSDCEAARKLPGNLELGTTERRAGSRLGVKTGIAGRGCYSDISNKMSRPPAATKAANRATQATSVTSLLDEDRVNHDHPISINRSYAKKLASLKDHVNWNC